MVVIRAARTSGPSQDLTRKTNLRRSRSVLTDRCCGDFGTSYHSPVPAALSRAGFPPRADEMVFANQRRQRITPRAEIQKRNAVDHARIRSRTTAIADPSGLLSAASRSTVG